MCENGSETLIFYEYLRRPAEPGVIAFSVVGPDGTLSNPQTCLNEPHHLSYPFVVEDDGVTYMTPETLGARAVTLYAATSFPTGWQRELVLVDDIDAVDPTIHFDGTTYWMWVGVVNAQRTAADQTYLFFAGELRGPWRPHPQNPVVSDIRTARPAGKVFSHEGRLIRPSQDCSVRYGRRLVFNEVRELSETGYAEEPIAWAEPFEPGAVGLHTYNVGSGIEVVDLCHSVSRLPFRATTR